MMKYILKMMEIKAIFRSMQLKLRENKINSNFYGKKTIYKQSKTIKIKLSFGNKVVIYRRQCT